MVRVRFAPSPTGNLHIGGVRTALYNYLFARANEGCFLLRIEDTDSERSDKLYIEHIIQSLEWLGLTIDEPPVFQSKRSSLYDKYFYKLVQMNAVYPCFCTSEELQKERQGKKGNDTAYNYQDKCRHLNPVTVKGFLDSCKPHNYRFCNRLNDLISWNDLIHGKVNYAALNVDDFIIKRSDGSYTYNYCAVVDDVEMNITHVIRGDDHISNTPKQLLIYRALDVFPPQYAHIPLIFSPDRKRLSKRHGACGLMTFRENGYLKEALINFCVLMGWSWDNKSTLFSPQELEEKFTLHKVSSSPSIFDNEKLNWLNRYYLRTLSIATIYEQLEYYWENLDWNWKKVETSKMLDLLKISRERTSTLLELAQTVQDIWDGHLNFDEEAFQKCLNNYLSVGLLPGLILILEGYSDWTFDSLEERLRSWADKNGYKFIAVVQVLRLALTGKLVSPPIIETACILDKETVLRRLQNLSRCIQNRENSLDLQ